MSEYRCFSCRDYHTTDNVVCYCAFCVDKIKSRLSAAEGEKCPLCIKANTAEERHTWLHWEKEALIEVILHLFKRIDTAEAVVEAARKLNRVVTGTSLERQYADLMNEVFDALATYDAAKGGK